MQEPAISILLPFHKEEKWLEEAIASIRSQTFLHWELLLLAHHASPAALEIATQSCLPDKRIQLFPVSGDTLAAVLNQGISMARGSYIARMDADDISHPDRFSEQWQYLESHPETGVVSCQTALHPLEKTGEGFQQYMAWQNAIITAEDHLRHRFVESPLAHPTVMFRASLISSCGDYPTEGPEDYAFWLRLMQQKVSFYKLPQPLLIWRDHPGRLSRTGIRYRQEAFEAVRIHHAQQVLKARANGRKLILCGAGNRAWKKKIRWEQAGIRFDGFSDVIARHRPLPYFAPETIGTDSSCYYISLLQGRGKSDEMMAFFASRGLRPEVDFLIAS